MKYNENMEFMTCRVPYKFPMLCWRNGHFIRPSAPLARMHLKIKSAVLLAAWTASPRPALSLREDLLDQRAVARECAA
jgi:hypothetical protein